MQIRSVRLTNIKSYEALEVHFTPGVNAITGHNGAGKSTLLEAIGFALFDKMDYTKPQFIKEGSAAGRVQVIFTAPTDRRDYLVERAVGLSSLWQVSDCESGMVLTKGKENVSAFLRHVLGLDEVADMGQLFSDAIGVAQGTLTAAFHLSTEKRRELFNPLLQVEEYKTAFTALNETRSHIEGQQHQNEVEAAGLKGRVAVLPDTRRAAAEIERRLGERGDLLTTRKVALDHATVELKEHDARKTAAEQASHALTLAQLQCARVAAALEQAAAKVDQAQGADRMVRENQAGCDRHLAAQQTRTALEVRQRERQTLLAEQASAGQARAAALSRVETLSRQLEVASAAERRAEELRAPAEEQLALKRQLDEANAQSAALRSGRQLLDSLTAQHAARQRQQNEMVQQVQQGLALSRQVHETESKISDADAKEKQLTLALGELTATGKALREHLQELEKLDGALCRVCHQPLTPEHRDRLMAEDNQRLIALRKDYVKVQSERDEAGTLRTSLQNRRTSLLGEQRGLATAAHVESVTREVDDLARQREAAAAEMRKLEDAPERVRKIGEALARMGDPAAERAGALAQAGQRPQLEAESAAARADAEQLDRRLHELAERLAPFARLDAELEEVDAELAATREAYTVVLAQRSTAAGLAAAVTELETQRHAEKAAQDALDAAETASAQAGAAYSAAAHEQAQKSANDLRTAVGSLTNELAMLRDDLAKAGEEIARMERDLARLDALEADAKKMERRARTLDKMRKVIKEAGPRITALRIRRISALADEVYRDLTSDYACRLLWDEDYALTLEVNGLIRPFKSLSGGEQMVAALAVRLALLREMSGLKLAFFDEPTANLDPTRRERLASQIASIQGFEQIFVISHDDTFEAATANVIRLEKQNGATVLIS